MDFKDLNVKPKTIKFLEENLGNTLFDIGLSNNFLDLSPQAREIRAKINKQDLNLKLFVQWRKPSTKQKVTTEWGKIFVNDSLMKA